MEKDMDMDENSALFAEILETSKYFTTMLNYIPVKHYLTPEENIGESDTKNRKRKKKAKVDKATLKQAKMLKLDPSSNKSIAECQKELEDDDMENSSVNPLRHCESRSIDELRERLHNKLELLRNKNGSAKTSIKKSTAVKTGAKQKEKKVRLAGKGNFNKPGVTDDKFQPMKNEDGVMFSKFDFKNESGNSDLKVKKKKDTKTLLKIAEKKKEKLEGMKAEDASAAEAFISDTAWSNVMKKAEGEKIKDDPKLLKKSIKRKQKQKEKSKKQWKERQETVTKQREDAQKKRKENLLTSKTRGKKDIKNKKGKTHQKRKPGF